MQIYILGWENMQCPHVILSVALITWISGSSGNRYPGKINFKNGAFAQLAVDGDVSLMVLYDSIDYR